MQFIVKGYPAYAYTGGRPFDPALPAIVFIHGAAMDHSAWQWQSRYFAHHGFCVLAVDLPGHGRSPGPLRGSIEALGDWISALIEAASFAKVHVVGHSMGSLVALDVALRHRARVTRLALIGTSIPMPVGESFLAAAKDDSPAAFDMEAVWGHAREAPLAGSPVPGTWLMGASRQLIGRATAGVQFAYLGACHGFAPTWNSIRALDAPTLVIAGRRDVMTPHKAAEQVANEIPGARFVVLDAGHSMMSEAPRNTLEALRAFLA